MYVTFSVTWAVTLQRDSESKSTKDKNLPQPHMASWLTASMKLAVHGLWKWDCHSGEHAWSIKPTVLTFAIVGKQRMDGWFFTPSESRSRTNKNSFLRFFSRGIGLDVIGHFTRFFLPLAIFLSFFFFFFSHLHLHLRHLHHLCDPFLFRCNNRSSTRCEVYGQATYHTHCILV